MNGIIVLDKPGGFTSFDAVAVLRGLTHQKKIGHTGTLDPMATGVLPVLLGRAAKAASLLPDTDKEYRARFRLGERRDTGDVTGQVVAESAAPVSREALEQVLPRFTGEISQVPPMYSAVSVGGSGFTSWPGRAWRWSVPPEKFTFPGWCWNPTTPKAGKGSWRWLAPREPISAPSSRICRRLPDLWEP